MSSKTRDRWFMLVWSLGIALVGVWSSIARESLFGVEVSLVGVILSLATFALLSWVERWEVRDNGITNKTDEELTTWHQVIHNEWDRRYPEKDWPTAEVELRRGEVRDALRRAHSSAFGIAADVIGGEIELLVAVYPGILDERPAALQALTRAVSSLAARAGRPTPLLGLCETHDLWLYTPDGFRCRHCAGPFLADFSLDRFADAATEIGGARVTLREVLPIPPLKDDGDART